MARGAIVRSSKNGVGRPSPRTHQPSTMDARRAKTMSDGARSMVGGSGGTFVDEPPQPYGLGRSATGRRCGGATGQPARHLNISCLFINISGRRLSNARNSRHCHLFLMGSPSGSGERKLNFSPSGHIKATASSSQLGP